MQLTTLVAPWVAAFPKDAAITGIENDSRRLKPGDVFLAYPGAVVDGRQFIAEALQKGVAAVIYEPIGGEDMAIPTTVPMVPIVGLADHIGVLAARFYEDPATAMHMVGVTGTNGKSTIAYQLAEANTRLGRRFAYIGTLGEGEVPQLQPLINTTPDGVYLQRLFHEYQTRGVEGICMEVTSHGLAMNRVAGIPFHQAIFTNLSHEHLDFHNTMAAYAEAKARLFANPALQQVFLNGDDEASAIMRAAVQSSKVEIFTYGVNGSHGIRAREIQLTRRGTIFHAETPWGQGEITIRAVGQFNVYNTLALMGALLGAGFSFQQVSAVIPVLSAVPGRMEFVSLHPWVVVDYSHKPLALENALKTMRKVNTGRLIVVFGCGGNRDREKRPMMGKIASQCADVVIVTNDNPRHEDPNDIIREIQQGIPPGAVVHVIPERRLAIEKALSLAGAQDAVLIAGKGHEAYQQVGAERHVFSDQAVVRSLLTIEE